MTPADFDWTEATVTLAARFNKSRKTKVQPIPADVADAIRDHLTGKPADALVWAGTWSSGRTGAEMLRRDLEVAGIAYAVEGPDGPEYADFHALRHTYLTMLGRNGVDLRTAQELAGHSTPLLTARYSHRRLHDLTGAVNKLPNLVPSMPIPVEIPLRMTGTDGDSGVPPGVPGVPRGVPGVPRGVPTGGIRPHRNAPMCIAGAFGGGSDNPNEPLEMTGAGASQHRPASIRMNEGDGGRTRNLRSDSPPSLLVNPRESKHFPSSTPSGCTAGCTKEQSEGGLPDADLAALVAVWPTLPEPIKAAIRALLGSVMQLDTSANLVQKM